MKYIIYTFYVVTVLLFSGFARANTLMAMVKADEQFRSPATIDSVGFADPNHQTLDLQITGYVPNPCYLNPSAILIMDKNDPNTLIIRLISPIPTTFCIQRIKDFSTIVSLPQLAQASQLPLEDKAIYVVKTEGFDYSLQVSGQDLNN